MSGAPGYLDAEAHLALVPIGDPHPGRLADQAQRRPARGVRQLVEQRHDALAAKLLVAGERDRDRLARSLRGERVSPIAAKVAAMNPFMSVVPRP